MAAFLFLLSVGVMMACAWLAGRKIRQQAAASLYIRLDKHSRPWRSYYGGSGEGGSSGGHGGHGGDCGGGGGDGGGCGH